MSKRVQPEHHHESHSERPEEVGIYCDKRAVRQRDLGLRQIDRSTSSSRREAFADHLVSVDNLSCQLQFTT